ncbi:uncharacterized protein PV09_00666 [Verruconis gallopava]|uniref:NIMA interactive protein n=1 Tax=Verruconis gallopava TaxID=253628 RepID=A0A0D2APV0_9PEZI|nr:uncharacterized protein PV09_00666 [Verruconis gallopava]KIW08723.1 hypothetical protein PV09_00666 [Verruconis gallopava]
MDSFNLKTASAYLNNLLLARGLLRNGKPIEFARPSKGEGGAEATMAQIINLVHDMILRRDREQEQREALAETLRSLRGEATRNAQTIDRLEMRNEDLTRQLSLANSQERSARSALRSAEASVKALREEMARMKATVQQIRISCANDVRKRDVQIQRLKSHLTAQQRGNKTGLVGASITITPGVTGASVNGTASRLGDAPDVDDPEYNLRQETTEFLTQLSQSLSDENDNLIGLVRSTLSTLKELQGIPDNAEQAALSNGSEDQGSDQHMVHTLPTSYESLAIDMHNVLENLRTLLTNPNFVSIDEVTAREEEIARLREGFDKIEIRWREAIALMDSWRKRMMNGGDTVNIEELKHGLGLGCGFGASVALRDHGATDSEAEDEPSFEEPADLADIEEVPSMVESVDLVPSIIPDDGKSKKSSAAYKAQPLKESTGNAVSPRKSALKIHKDKEPPSSENAEERLGSVTRHPRNGSTSKPKQSSATGNDKEPSRIPRKTKKRLSSPHPHGEERSPKRNSSPKLTMQEKLNIAQAEAEAAAVAAGSEVDELDIELEGLEHDRVRKGEIEIPKPRARRDLASNSRKTKIGGRPKRRKSTLTPEELESLMFVS